MGEHDSTKVRRTRGPASEKRGKVTVRINGQSFSKPVKAINHMATLEINFRLMPTDVDHGAASVEAGGPSVAKAANSPAAGTDHPAYAEVASDRTEQEAERRVPSEPEEVRGVVEELPAGQGEMPADSRSFVAQVNARVDLCAAWERLVRAKDLKISQRALEKLSELDFKLSTSSSDEPRIFDSGVPARGSV